MPAAIAAVWVIALLGGALIWFAMRVDEHRKLSKRSRALHDKVETATDWQRFAERWLENDFDREYEELCRRG